MMQELWIVLITVAYLWFLYRMYKEGE